VPINPALGKQVSHRDVVDPEQERQVELQGWQSIFGGLIKKPWLQAHLLGGTPLKVARDLQEEQPEGPAWEHVEQLKSQLEQNRASGEGTDGATH